MTNTIAIIPAAGSGSRTGLTTNKVLINTGVMPVITNTLIPFIISPYIDKIIVLSSSEDKDIIDDIIKNLNTDKEIISVIGGNSRTESVKNALPYAKDYDVILIHDAARPFVTVDLIERVILSAMDNGASTAAIPIIDTIKKVTNGIVMETLNRLEYMAIQTPQAFNAGNLIKAYSMIDDKTYTDDCGIYEEFIGTVRVVEGNTANVKITTKEDFTRYFPIGYRVGIGYDVHQLVEGRQLILGGVNIPHYKGLLGHSDADCLVHSIMDSLLTATGNRDIGILFPDTDNRYKSINSLILLEKVYNMINEQGYKINNVSAEIIADKPKLMNYIPLMQENIAKILNIDSPKISIAATTSEGLGITGEEKAIAVYAISSVINK